MRVFRQTDNQEALLFAELRSTLHACAWDRPTWEQLCQILDQLQDTDTALHYVRSYLPPWPPHRRPAPQAWLREKLGQGKPRYWGLVHAVCCDGAVLEASLCRKLCDHVLDGEQVVSFQARQAHLNESEMGAFLDHEAWRSIRHLDLSLTPLEGAKALALAKATHLHAVERLELGGTRLQNRGLLALGGAEGFGGLKSMSLEDTRIGVLGLQGLQDAPWWPGLECLDLSGNHLGRHGASVLGEALARSGIKTLGLRGVRSGA